MDAGKLLSAVSQRVKQTFEEHRAVLSYAEWFEQFLADPAAHLRNSAQYLKDVFDHYGRTERVLPQGPIERFNLFDAPWADGHGRVAGQESVQREMYRLISNFVRDGRNSRLILLHGPNGSAKSSIVRCIQAAAEHYSLTPQGALYTYAWIFPSERVEKGRLGFTTGQNGRRQDSYAHLPWEQVDARLPCELRDHPIFLIPRSERLSLLEQLRSDGKLPDDFVLSRYMLDGDLSPRDRAIHDALLFAHDGDHEEVLRYIQIERFYVSLKYGKAVATVEPQMHVDAEARQLTADRSIANLPRSLQTVPLHELVGPLIAANRGMLEFSDLLKRPVEAFKYLLSTSEEGTVSLPQFTIYLDELLVATSNENQLGAFKEYPDWNSFKGRIELVRVPYLLRFSEEVEIYERQVTPTFVDRPLAPHTIEVAARWAVLTRLKWPDPDEYPEPVRSIVARMTPSDKLRLYDNGAVPGWVSAKDAPELSRRISELIDEYRSVAYYEGQRGASAREIRTLLLNAAHRPGYRCLSPLAVFDELVDLVRDPSIYAFLRQEPKNGYHENDAFIEIVREWWLDVLDDEFRSSMGLVEEAQYEGLFTKYVVHVSHHVKSEKVHDKVTDNYVAPDERMMREVEELILAEGEKRADFRRQIIARIGAWGLEHPNETPNYRTLFPRYLESMEADYYERQRRRIARTLAALLEVLSGEQGRASPEEREAAQRTIRTMQGRFGYEAVCTSECAAYLRQQRYARDE